MSGSRPEPARDQRPGWRFFGDPFSWHGWRPEGAIRILPPRRAAWWGWQQALRDPRRGDPELLLIEPAWEGFSRLEDRFTRPIQLARAFRNAGIPVLFWNKEDPVHFERFLRVARECDVVLTSDAECVERYRDAGFRGPVEPLPFPVQPSIHRQYLPKDPAKRIFFAGTWRPHHEERQRGFEALVLPALDFGLDIFARRGQWPPECEPHILTSYPYLDLLVAYSAYSVGLNICSVKDSSTMYPRRVGEMTMANILVLSDRCRALSEMFPEIPQSDSATETRRLIEHFLAADDERLAIVERVKARFLRHHTYERRYFQLRELALNL